MKDFCADNLEKLHMKRVWFIQHILKIQKCWMESMDQTSKKKFHSAQGLNEPNHISTKIAILVPSVSQNFCAKSWMNQVGHPTFATLRIFHKKFGRGGTYENKGFQDIRYSNIVFRLFRYRPQSHMNHFILVPVMIGIWRLAPPDQPEALKSDL